MTKESNSVKPKRCSILLLFLCFKLHDFRRGRRHYLQIPVTHLVKQSIKLAAGRTLFSCLVTKQKMIHRDVLPGDEVKKDLEAGMLALVLYVGKIAWRDKQLPRDLVSALITVLPRVFECLSKNLKIIGRERSFHLIGSFMYLIIQIHTFYSSSLSLDMSNQFLL